MSDTRIRLLQYLLQQNVTVLEPERNRESFCGYSYPKVQEFIGEAPGTEIDMLNRLAEVDLFNRQVVDKIHLCPGCHHYAINFREICPHCQSPLITQVELFHHYACGFIGEEGQFRHGVRIECPKCQQTLRHIGVDYERPGQAFRCQACQTGFSEPDVSGLSLVCGQVFDVDQAIMYLVYSYRLTEQGRVAAAKGVIEERPDRPFLVDPRFHVYSSDFFKEELNRELARTSRHQRTFSVLFLRLSLGEGHRTHPVRELPSPVLQRIVDRIQETIRGSDLMALYGENYFALLLPETPASGAAVAAKRLNEILHAEPHPDYGEELTLEVAQVEGPGTFKNIEDMIDTALSRLKLLNSS